LLISPSVIEVPIPSSETSVEDKTDKGEVEEDHAEHNPHEDESLLSGEDTIRGALPSLAAVQLVG